MLEEFFKEFHEELMKVPSEFVVLFMSGKMLGKNYSNKAKNFDSLKKIFEDKKLGKLTLKTENKKEKEFVFKLDDTAFKTKLKKSSCYVVAGILAGFVENHHRKYAGATETKCVSKGDSHCQFLVKVIGQ